METELTNPPKRKHRWFQFSLRSLLVISTIVAVQCAVCLPMLREWQMRNRTTERIRMVSVLLSHDWARSHNWYSGSTTIPIEENLDR